MKKALVMVAGTALIGGSIFYTACGGGGGGGGGGASGPSLNPIEYEIKQLLFSWPAVAGADLYRILENPDGVSGYTAISGDLTVNTYNHDIGVHLQDWANANYLLEACSGGDCDTSGARYATDSVAAIGYLKASNTGALDNFGNAVAVSDDGSVIAVGAYTEDGPDGLTDGSGAVYVYVREAGVWLAPQYLTASNLDAGDGFGISAALSADGATLAVGAWNENNGTANETGAVYIFDRDPDGNWVESTILRAAAAGHGDNFGRAVALGDDGNTLAVGAPGDSTIDPGYSTIFTRSGAVWSEQDTLQATSVDAGAGFGQSVALSSDGTVLAAGAWQEDDGGNTKQGAAYVFTYDAGWGTGTRLTASDREANDRFGVSVALSPDGATLAVGAYNADSGANLDTGAAYVFLNDGGWSEQQLITPDAAFVSASDKFGVSVALGGSSGDILVVGASGEDGNSSGVSSSAPVGEALDSGAAYTFTRDIGVWSQHSYVKASNTGEYDQFGVAVALSADGETLVVGASDEDSNATGIGGDHGDSLDAQNSGAAYLY